MNKVQIDSKPKAPANFIPGDLFISHGGSIYLLIATEPSKGIFGSVWYGCANISNGELWTKNLVNSIELAIINLSFFGRNMNIKLSAQ